MQLRQGDIIEVAVNRDFGEQEDFFRLEVPGFGEQHLTKLKFQKEEPLPETLNVRVKFFDKGGNPILGHYLPQYVHRFYRVSLPDRSYEYEFTVKGLPAHRGDHFTLEDNHGIRYNLTDPNAMLALGQKVHCRFTKLTQSFFNLQLANSDMRLQYFTPEEFFARIGTHPRLAKVLTNAIDVHLPEVGGEIKDGNPLWIVSAMRQAVENMTDWIVTSHDRFHQRFLLAVIDTLHTAGLYILENSRFLRSLSAERRRNLQVIITECVESLKPYRDTIKLVYGAHECGFVESLLQKLRESGYLYHPARKLSMLMMVFRMRPELVHEYLGKLFETIMAWDLDTWTTEPFRSAMVSALQMYITQTSREIDLMPQADNEEESDRIEKIVTAIALQMFISGHPDDDNYRRNRSLFYRYVSLMRPVKSDELLDKAFLTLMGAKLPLDFSYDTIKEPLMLLTRSSVDAPEDVKQLNSMFMFQNGPVRLLVDSDGVSLTRTDEESPARVLPNGMMEWLQPRVFVNRVQSLNGGQLKNFDAHRRLWANIESALFDKRTEPSAAVSKKRKADVGDVVKIIISAQESQRGDNPKWMAIIDDEDFETADGFICRDDIVTFKLTSSDLDRNRNLVYNAFIDENGSPRQFSATVSEIIEDGDCEWYHFSLLDDIADQVDTILNYQREYLAVIAKVLDHEYSAISETGYGVFLRCDPSLPAYTEGNCVRFRVIERQNVNHIVGTIVEDADNCVIDKVQAFCNLLNDICLVREDEEDIQATLNIDETLTRDAVAEIIEIIRFKAISTKELLMAYDYLCFARLLARLIEDDTLATRLAIHADMLRLHQFYAINRRIDADELDTYRPQIQGYPMLEMVFHRLEIVSWLGDNDHNPALWDTINKRRSLLETSLAQLVLSFNLLPEGTREEGSVAEGLKTKIAQMLGVNFEARQLKSYGRETQYVEFKSSLVYPARKSKDKEIPRANPELQQLEILRQIAAFLNSGGGTLYIGVNDKTRMEAGLFEDYQYYAHRKAAIGHYFYEMKDADNVCVFLTNLVMDRWGRNVAGYVEVDRDPEATKDVIMVKVRPRTVPVELDGEIYVRRSNNTVRLRDEERDEFITERKMLDERGKTVLNAPEVARTEQIPVVEPARPVSEPSSSDESTSLPVAQHEPQSPLDAVVADESGIMSLWRPNALHSWEAEYVQPEGYLYIFRNGTMQLFGDDRNIDYDEDCLAALSFTGKEARQGFLIMIFDRQQILKVPMSEVLEKGYQVSIPHYHGSRLLFVTIALPGDGILVHLTDSKNNLSRRVMTMADIPSAHLNSTPGNISDVSGAGHVVGAELVGEGCFEHFRGSMVKELSGRQIGYALRTAADSVRAREIFEDDVKHCTRVSQ
ncbi:MAG: ATP-binding protein [Muribaculaceae bacterium]|nr:ATP-binding protein [Muribaculaceae bacterium]